MVISADTLATIAENAAEHRAGETVDDRIAGSPENHPWSMPESQPSPRRTSSGRFLQIREHLQRMQAHRDRMAAMIKLVRDPEHHGALRHAVLRLDAEILSMRRATERLRDEAPT